MESVDTKRPVVVFPGDEVLLRGIAEKAYNRTIDRAMSQMRAGFMVIDRSYIGFEMLASSVEAEFRNRDEKLPAMSTVEMSSQEAESLQGAREKQERKEKRAAFFRNIKGNLSGLFQ